MGNLGLAYNVDKIASFHELLIIREQKCSK